LNAPRWRKRWMAVTCSHGHLINQTAADQALAFRKDYKPHTVLHLGDFLDQTAFMGSALGSDGKEACEDIGADLVRGLQFVEQLRPNVLFLGNHDVRAFELQTHPKALVAHAAREVVKEIEGLADTLGADLVPYNGACCRKSWRMLGDTAFGHGVFYSQRAGEDHALLLGCPVVFGHTHRIEVLTARTHGAWQSYNIGCLADIPRLRYASRRRATTMWANGWAYGEYGDGWCNVEIHRCKRNLEAIPAI
jgi:hypothetical protein